MENSDFNRHPPTFGSDATSPLMQKESNYRYDIKSITNSRSGLLKDSMVKESMRQDGSFTSNGKEMGSLQLLAEILNSKSDWKDVPDIVKWSVKAIYDSCQQILSNQNRTRKDVERGFSSMASKAELTSYLTVKANITDVSVAISEVATLIESKIDEETFNNVLNDRPTYEDLQQLNEKKIDVEDFEEIMSKIDIEGISDTLKTKASWTDVNELVSNKVDRETFANTIQNQCNYKPEFNNLKSTLEERIEKIETSFKQKLEKILEAQDQFINLVETGELVSKKQLYKNNPIIEDLRIKLDSKLDRREIDTYSHQQMNNLNKLKDDVHEIISKFNSTLDHYKKDCDINISEVNDKLSKDIKVMKNNIEDTLVTKNSVKQEIDGFKKEIDRKIESIKQDVIDVNKQVELHDKKPEQNLIERIVRLEIATESSKDEAKRAKDKIKMLETRMLDEDDNGYSTSKSFFRSTRNDPSEQITVIKNLIENTKKDIMTDVYTGQKDIDQLKSSKLDCLEYLEFKNHVQTFINAYTSGQMANSMSKEAEISQKSIKALETYFSKEIKSLKTSFQMDMDTLECQLISKIDLKDSKYQFLEMLNDKLDRKEFDRLKLNLVSKQQFDELKYQVEESDNNDHIYQLLEQKAEIDHVNKALTEIHEELDYKANAEEVDVSIKAFESINEAL